MGHEQVDAFLRSACGADSFSQPRVDRAQALLAGHPELTRENVHAAAAAGDVEALRAAADVTAAGGPWNAAPLVYACLSAFAQPGRIQAARVLLQRGADPDTAYRPVECPDSPLSCLYGAAGRRNDPELAALLLDAGANPNDGESLYHSTGHRDHACLRLLIQHGARFEKTNALPRMLDFEDPEGLQICLDAGADVNEETVGHTALHHAILRGRSAGILSVLVNAGARLDARDKQRRTPLMLARRRGHNAAAALLEQHGAPEDPLDPTSAFLAACASADEKTTRLAADNNPGLVSRLGEDDLRLLPEQAQAGHYEAVRLMLDLGFPVATKGDWQASALNQAAFRGDVAMVKLLLAHGARPDERNGYGGDAFGSAIWPYLNDPVAGADYLGVVRALLEAGGTIPAYEIDDEPLRRLFDEFRKP